MENIRLLRNSIQHIAQRIDMMISKNLTILGSLSWFTCTDSTEMRGVCCTLVAGTVIHNSEHPFVNPCGKNIELPVDLITFSASGYSVCFSELMKYIRIMVKDFEDQLSQKTSELPKAGADFLVCAHIRPSEEQKDKQQI